MNDLIKWSLILATVSALQIILLKNVSSKFSTPTLISMIGIIYILMTSIYVYVNRSTVHSELGNLDHSVYGILIAIAIAGAISVLIYNTLVAKYPAEHVSSMMAFTPLMVVLLSFLFLEQQISSEQMIAIGMICVGAYLLNK
jgi:uncharacterized membrane protein